MTQSWQDFLSTLDAGQQAQITDNCVFPLTDLAIINVVGADAGRFLQGQLTCNINDLNDAKASMAAFCNAKGRVITVLVCIKVADSYRLILPRDLLKKVYDKLKMYVLRAKVTLEDRSDQEAVVGLYSPTLPNLPTERYGITDDNLGLCLRLSATSPIYLQLCNSQQALHLCRDAGLTIGTISLWRHINISCGIPWFAFDQSEQYIPQMLNLDKLDGISFNKGCYTGQEIVARTHYLGHSKRCLYLGEYSANQSITAGESILDADTQQTVGHVLAVQSLGVTGRLLLVLQSIDGEAKKLILGSNTLCEINLVSFQ